MNTTRLFTINPNKNEYEALGFFVLLLFINVAMLIIALITNSTSMRLALLPILMVTSVKPIIKMKKNKLLNKYL